SAGMSEPGTQLYPIAYSAVGIVQLAPGEVSGLRTRKIVRHAEATREDDSAEDGRLVEPDVGERSIQEIVLGRLRRAILSGEPPPGARLFQEDVASRLGVSRSPVREAFFRLEAEGLVMVTPHKGAVGAGLDLEG